VVEWGLVNPLRLPALIQQSPNKINYGSTEILMLDFLKNAYSQFFSKANRNLLSEHELLSSKNSFWLPSYAQRLPKKNYEGEAWGMNGLMSLNIINGLLLQA
jgi:N-acetyl-beta-hexosaminidase